MPRRHFGGEGLRREGLSSEFHNAGKEAAGRTGPEGWKGKGCAGTAANINQGRELSALRQRGPALGTRVFPKSTSSSRADRSPRGGAEVPSMGLCGQTSSCTSQAASEELSGRPRKVEQLLPTGQGGLTRSPVEFWPCPADTRWAEPAVHWFLEALINALSDALAPGVQLSHSPDPRAGSAEGGPLVELRNCRGQTEGRLQKLPDLGFS